MIKSLTYKNGLSYGNQPTTIDFTTLNGIVLVKGENGAGKTNLIHILEYAAYGKSRKFSKDAIPNWSNRAFYSEMVLHDPNSESKETKIIRGISPDIAKLEGRENKYSKPNLDKFIANEVIGIPHELFINTILLSVSDFKSFLDMKDSDKTKIIDKLFSTDYYSDMLSLSKKKASQISKDVSNLEALIEDKNKTIADLNIKISNIEAVNPDDISTKITDCKNSIAAKTIELHDKKIELPKLESQLSAVSLDISNKTNDKQKSIFDINNKRNIATNELNKEYNQSSIKIETEENNTVDSKIKELTDSYNKSIEAKESEIKAKITENENVYKEYRTQVIAPSYNKEVAEITTVLNESLANNKTEESNEIHIVAVDKETKLDLLYTNIKINDETIKNAEAVLKEDTKKLNDILSDIKIAENSIKLYEQGRCEMCTVELHNNEYHDARKKQLEESLVVLNSDKTKLEDKINENSNVIAVSKQFNATAQNEISEVKLNAVKQVNAITESKNKADNEAQAKFNKDKGEITEKYKGMSDEKKNSIDSLTAALMNELNEYKKEAFNTHNNEVKQIEEGKRKNITSRQDELRKEVDLKRDGVNKEFDEKLKQEDLSYKSILENLNAKKAVLEGEVMSLKTVVVELESGIKSMEGQIEMFTTLMQNSNMSVQLHKMVDDMVKEVDSLYAKRLELMEKSELYDDLNYLLGENGVKTEYLKQILPMFNATINEVCERLNFRYRFTFNEQFDVNLTWNGNKIPNNISKGQEAVVNLAISLASIKMILMRKQRVNIMFLDELFSNLDPGVIDLAVSMLAEFAKSYDVTLFIMSHTPIPMAHISHIMEVAFDENFSALSIDKCV